MSKAKRVHSTPRQTASKIKPPNPRPVADPIFAAIEHHKKLSAAFNKAVNHPDVGDYRPQFAAVNAISNRAGRALIDHADQLFEVRAKTLVGLAALLKYISTLKDWQMPRKLSEPREIAVLKKLCKTAALALERIGGV
jgi:hypothetical protein